MNMIKNFLKKSFIFELYQAYKLHRFQNAWRKRNEENFTTAYNVFDTSLVHVGKASYGELNLVSFASKGKLHIGNFVSIAQEVAFILDAEHHIDHISTYPFKVKYLGTEKEEAFGKGDIFVEDDVWIGYRSIIMSGVRIGKGAVIAAGSVVTKDVPAYSVVGGVPAKVIKYRFSQEIQELLMKVDYERLDKDYVNNHLALLYDSLDKNETVEALKKLVNCDGSG